MSVKNEDMFRVIDILYTYNELVSKIVKHEEKVSTVIIGIIEKFRINNIK